MTWSVERSRFNHDWLKNSYLPALNLLVDRLSNPPTDGGAGPDRLLARLGEWHLWRPPLTDLLATAETALSPRGWVDETPADAAPPAVRSALADLAHLLWLARSRVTERVRAASDAVTAADTAYAALTAAVDRVPLPRTWATLAPLRDTAIAFRDACAAVATAIGALPRDGE